MTALSTAETREPHPLWLWLKKRPLEALPMLGFLLALFSFALIAFPAFARGNGQQLITDLVAHSYVLIWMMLASTMVRTVGVRQVMTLFLSGFFLSTGVAILLTGPLLDLFGSNDLTVALWVPLIEELTKMIPLVLFLWAYHRRRGQAHGISDVVILGFAVGAGMAMHEDIFYGRAIVSGDGSILGAFTDPLGALLPTLYSGPGILTTGHSGWGAAIGLGLAVASIYFRKRILALCFAVAGLLIAVVDHASLNMRGVLEPLVVALSVNHALPIVLLILGFPLAIVYDVLRRRHRPPALPRPNWGLYRAALGGGRDPWTLIVNFLALGHYRRGWTSAAYAAATGPNRGNDYPRLSAWYRVVASSGLPTVGATTESGAAD